MVPSFSLPANYLLPAEPLSARPQSGDVAAERPLKQPRHVARAIARLFLLALPALLTGYLMSNYVVDVPFGDQWDGLAPLFVKMRSGLLGFSDFFAFHNEHRIFFPRLLMFSLGELTNWSIPAEVAVIWVLACFCAINVFCLARVTGFGATPSRMWLLLAANVLLFTPVQWENLIWGFQIGFFLPLVTMTALPWTAGTLGRPWNFVVTLLLCVVSTFSIASGFCSWLVAAPVLLFCGERKRNRGELTLWIIWIAVALASVIVYFRGYQRPEHHPSQLEALHHPVLFCQFVLTYLGNPFCNGTELDSHAVGQVTGAVLLAALAATAIYLWRFRRDRHLVTQTLPWISLASITLFNGALTAVGRIGFGLHGAIQSRYVSFAVLLPVALIFLCARIEPHWRARNPAAASRLRLSLASVGAVFAALLLLNSVYCMRVWGLFQHDRFTAKAVLALRDIVDEPMAISRFVHFNAANAREWADVLEQVGYLRPARLRSSHLREIAGRTNGVNVGELDQVLRGAEGQVAASGWAILPMKGRVADSVILAYDKGDDDPIIFARANVTGRRDDIATQMADGVYLLSGWTIKWKRSDLPSDAKRITAWAFDAESCRAYEVGAARIN